MLRLQTSRIDRPLDELVLKLEVGALDRPDLDKGMVFWLTFLETSRNVVWSREQDIHDVTRIAKYCSTKVRPGHNLQNWNFLDYRSLDQIYGVHNQFVYHSISVHYIYTTGIIPVVRSA